MFFCKLLHFVSDYAQNNISNRIENIIGYNIDNRKERNILVPKKIVHNAN